MSIVSYISFPNALNAFLLSDIVDNKSDYGISYCFDGWRKDMYLFPDVLPADSRVILIDIKGAHFTNCFNNKFIYEIGIDPPNGLTRKRARIAASNMDNATKQQELRMLNDTIKIARIQSLYDFIHKHIDIGEFVELYNAWTDHENFRFDSPTHEMTISLDDLLRFKKFPWEQTSLKFDERRKVIIFKGNIL